MSTVSGAAFGLPNVMFTLHALERLVDAIRETLTDPDWRFTPRKYPDNEDRTSDKHDLTLCTADEDGKTVVVTALPSSKAGWDRLFRLGLLGGTRDRRYEHLHRLRPDTSFPMTDPTAEAS
jgi:hypothetical protein